MPRKFLEVHEALALFEALPSREGSEASDDNSSDDEYVPLQPDLTGVNDSDSDSEEESTIMQNADMPGPSQVEEIIWKRKDSPKAGIPEFLEDYGPSNEILSLEDKSPISLFLSMLTVTFLESIVFQTNLYATQKGKTFLPLNLSEMYRFLAINLLMGIKKLPSYRDYWSSCEILNDAFISNLMPVKRFSWILGHMHLNDNSIQPQKGDKTFDKLYKIRPLIIHLSERFLSVFRPGKNQSVDESMVRFKGRSSLKQYMPKKPIKRGYKIWMRCDQSGFACQFQIYTGKTNENIERNLGERVVRDLTETLVGKNHCVYMDNYFTSYSLFKFLETQNIFACGTAIISRKNLPRNLSDDKVLQRGEFDWAVSNDKILCLKWRDRGSKKKCVTIVSTLGNETTASSVSRKEKDGTMIQVPCPQAIIQYNKNMGYVDYFDQLKSLYEIDRKSKKWWHRLFFHFIDMTVTNAFILNKELPDDCEYKNMKEFRLSVIESLVILGKSEVEKKKTLIQQFCSPNKAS